MEISETIDARGLLCPLPVLKLRKRLKSLAAGQCALLLADDPAAVIDVPHFCAESGHELLEVRTHEEAQAYCVKKSAPAP
jgi:tRNA 2-thiouridine synthesizing protein A